MSEKILDRLVKLFALAENNPSANEAQAAILMAQKIMAEHAISEDAVRLRGEVNEARDEIGKDVVEENEGRVRKDPLKSILASCIADYFRVMMWNDLTTGTPRIVFAGYGNDRKVAALVYRFALDAMTQGAADYMTAWKVVSDNTDPARSRTERQSWLLGFVKGLREGFKAALSSNPQWLATSRVPQAVIVWVASNTKLRSAPASRFNVDGTGDAHGKRAGHAFASQHNGGRQGAIGSLRDRNP